MSSALFRRAMMSGRKRTITEELKSILSWSRLWVGEPGSITIATGVSVWKDSSGNGGDLTQGTAGTQPSWTATSPTRGYVKGNGSQGLSTPSTDLAFLHSGAGSTLVAILKTSGTTDNYALGNQTGSGVSRGFSISRRPSPNMSVAVGSGAGVLVSNTIAIGADTSAHEIILTYRSGTDPDLVVLSDGSPAGTVNEVSAPSALASSATFGVCYGGNGLYPTTTEFSLVGLVSRVITSDEIAAVRAALATWT